MSRKARTCKQVRAFAFHGAVALFARLGSARGVERGCGHGGLASEHERALDLIGVFLHDLVDDEPIEGERPSLGVLRIRCLSFIVRKRF